MASSSGMEGAAEERRRQWPPWSSLEGKIVMVTGASSGIGRDFCLDLAAAGCRVVAAARRIDRLESLCAEINAREPPALRAVAVELDMSAEEATIAPAVERAWSAFGRIDSLVMALELGAYNIGVNSISPGIFKSEITEALVKKKWLKDVAAKIIPLKTHGTVDPALTSLLRYLIHDASNYVTGNIFVVDAGHPPPRSPHLLLSLNVALSVPLSSPHHSKEWEGQWMLKIVL